MSVWYLEIHGVHPKIQSVTNPHLKRPVVPLINVKIGVPEEKTPELMFLDPFLCTANPTSEGDLHYKDVIERLRELVLSKDKQMSISEFTLYKIEWCFPKEPIVLLKFVCHPRITLELIGNNVDDEAFDFLVKWSTPGEYTKSSALESKAKGRVCPHVECNPES